MRTPEFSSLAAGPSARLQQHLAAREEVGEVAVNWPGIKEGEVPGQPLTMAIIPYQRLRPERSVWARTHLRVYGGVVMWIGGLSSALTVLWQFKYMIIEGCGYAMILGGAVCAIRAIRG